MSTERDNHFQNFAKLLWEELIEKGYTWENYDPDNNLYRDSVVELIAQRAYDLSVHNFMHVGPAEQAEYGDPCDCVSHVPDLTTWDDVSAYIADYDRLKIQPSHPGE